MHLLDDGVTDRGEIALVVPAGEIKCPLLSASDQEAWMTGATRGARKHDRRPRPEIQVARVKSLLVKGREVIHHFQAPAVDVLMRCARVRVHGEFHERIPVVAAFWEPARVQTGIKGPVACLEVKEAVGVGGYLSARLPDAPQDAIRRRVEDSAELELAACNAEAEEPAVGRKPVGMRAER